MPIEKTTNEVRQARSNTNLRYVLIGSMILVAIAFWAFMSAT